MAGLQDNSWFPSGGPPWHKKKGPPLRQIPEAPPVEVDDFSVIYVGLCPYPVPSLKRTWHSPPWKFMAGRRSISFWVPAGLFSGAKMLVSGRVTVTTRIHQDHFLCLGSGTGDRIPSFVTGILGGGAHTQNICQLVGGWTNPSEKYARQIGSFPQFSGWK